MADKPKEIAIDSTLESSKGYYSNAVKVSVTNSEAVIDFALLFPDEKKVKNGVLVSRLIVNHDLAGKLADSITKTLNEHLKTKKK
ncbi:MAG: DUF3467 domain-containing protein [Candidatus Roizmanbacteria bacterium]|nr:DUF3467 domain-containing protein [Candidatus Roizmanbacteria bacterium]